MKNLNWCVIWTIERRFFPRCEKWNKLERWHRKRRCVRGTTKQLQCVYSQPCFSRSVSCRVVRTSSNDHFVTLFRLDSWKFHVSLSLCNIANWSVCLCWYITGRHRRPIARDCVPCQIATDQEDGVSHNSSNLDGFSGHCVASFSSLLRFYITWCCVQRGRLAIRISGAHWMSTRYPILLSALSILSGITAYSFRKSAYPVAMEHKRRYCIPMRIEEYFVRSCNVIL